MTTAVLLIVLGTLCRLAPHPHNMVPMGALALYAGARLPRRWAVLVPLLAMVASDLWLDRSATWPTWTLTRATSYATFALVVLAGRWSLTGSTSNTRRFGMSLAASSLFFLTTNFAVWLSPQIATPEHPGYAVTLSGLAVCYREAIPFFGNTLAADLLGTAVLFGLDSLAHGVALRRKSRVAVAAE